MSETIYMETQVNSMVRILEGRIRIDSQWQRMDHVIQIFNSVQFSRSVLSNSLQPHESQHARPPCRSPTPRVHWDSRPSSQWCHPAISSSVVPFSSCPQSLPDTDKMKVAHSCPTLCDPMDRSTSGLPVHHQLLELAQTHVHPVCDAIQPSHPLSSPSPPAPNPFQHQGLF